MSGRGGRGRGRGDRGSSSGDRGRGGGSFRGFSPAAPGQVYAAASGIPEPSAEITKAEDDYLKQIKSSGLPDLSTLEISDGAERFPRRPAYGTKGKPVKLWANYFEFIPPPDLLLYRYSVEVKEKAGRKGTGGNVPRKKLEQTFRLLLQLPPFRDHRKDIVTDFRDQIISRVKFSATDLQLVPDQIQYRAEDEDDARIHAPFYSITIVPTGTSTVSDLTDYLTSTNPRAAFDKQPVLQALNIFLNHYVKASPAYATVGGSKSFPLNPSTADTRDLGAGLRAIRGFFASVRVATSRILVNVNVSNAAFYNPLPLDQSMQAFATAYGPNKTKLQEFLKRVRVVLKHIPARKNKAGKLVPRVKTIFALATRNDGRGGDDNEHAPKVKEFGAGPKDVEFWLSDTPPEGGAPPAPAAAKAGGKKGKKAVKAEASSGGSGPKAPASGVGGRYISVADHFLNNYRMQTNPRLPVVNTGTTANPSYAPAEACEIQPGQSSQAKLDPGQTANMIAFAVRAPYFNARQINEEGPREVGLASQVNGDMSRFGITVKPRMITVPGRILDSPKVKYGGQTVKMFPASWNMESERRQPLQFNTKSTLASWRAIVLNVQGIGTGLRNPREMAEVMGAFHTALVKAGINAQQPGPGMPVSMQDPNDPELENALKAVKEQLCLVILPAKHTVLYNRVKKIADTNVGVHTVCVVGSKVSNQRGQDKYMANVALKFNLKLGGVNQKIDDAKLGIVSEGKTMVVGIDVTHPSPGSAETAPSVAGMVASIDKHLAQWPAELRIQAKSRQENVSSLTAMLKSRLNLWGTKGGNKQLPENILIYRDGVSEGQYNMILKDELPLLRKACEEVYPAPDLKKGLPNMAIIVVGKRHHTRFYSTDSNSSITDKNGNPINGTVVDRHVTEARNWDFFLQSHNALQGTARPAHYFIVLDEIFTKNRLPQGFSNHADVLEDLTHNMCYLFGRATKAVSICPPAYYADLVCERARCYLSGHFDASTPVGPSAASEASQTSAMMPTDVDVKIHPKLKDTMFYI